MPKRDYYETLEVSRDASSNELKKAFKKDREPLKRPLKKHLKKALTNPKWRARSESRAWRAPSGAELCLFELHKLRLQATAREHRRLEGF